MISATEIHKIAKEIIEKYGDDYDNIGIRIQDSDYGKKAGDTINHISKHWIDGEMTDIDTDGVCAIDAREASERILDFGYYEGSVIIVIESIYSTLGEDDGEIIMRGDYYNQPTILEVIKK